jgi:pyruvate/oxaloacetate carboxyltransferase
MSMQSDFLSDLCDFLYPRSPYYGQFKPEYLAFNANLQEFSQRVDYICSLQTSGKISPQEAYKQIHFLWKQLKRAKKSLEIK